MTDRIDRRRFVRNTALTGIAAGVAAYRTRAAVMRTGADEAPANRVVVGVMGLSRGKDLAHGFSKLPGVDVKYVCDVDSTRAESCASQLESAGIKKPEAITDFRRILDDKSVDALVCAAPNHWHAPASILACAAGKHVYVEKPCCHNPREGELMVEAARKFHRAVQMGSQRRSGAGTIEAIHKLHAGVIGRVYLARSWYNADRPSIGRGKEVPVPGHLNYDLWQGPAPRRPYLDNVVHYNWHWRWHWGNGELGNNGIHTLDLCRWGLNVDYPIRVVSSGGRYHHAEDDQETPDTHAVSFEFADRRQITWEGLSCNRHGSGFVTFYGDQGTLELDSDGNYFVYDLQDKRTAEAKNHSRGDTEHLLNLITAIRTDQPLQLNAEILEGYKSTLLCHLGNIAQRTGRTLNCDPTNGHILQDPAAMALWTREYEPNWEPRV